MSRHTAVAPQQLLEEDPSPIVRLLACDDVLGGIYSSCADTSTKHALRVSCAACYRSPAINSFIHDFELGPHMTPEDAASALAAFPRLAQMRSLTIHENNVESVMQHLLGQTPEAAAARAKLQCVDSLRFFGPGPGLQLGSCGAAAILLMFPVMWSDHGRIQLPRFCTVSNGFLETLSAQSRITELQLHPPPSKLRELASFGSLKSLSLAGSGAGPLSLEPLCSAIPSGPRLQLTKLSLTRLADVTGLDMCLACHPLEELELISISFPASLASTMCLASPTLKAMRIQINLTFPDISTANFPALRVIEIGDFYLNQVHDMDAEDCVQRCTCLASCIAGFPCV